MIPAINYKTKCEIFDIVACNTQKMVIVHTEDSKEM